MWAGVDGIHVKHDFIFNRQLDGSFLQDCEKFLKFSKQIVMTEITP
jgi:hypothetical protein